MIQFICLFLPAFISILIIQMLEKRTLNSLDLIVKYFSFVVLINTVNIFLLVYLSKNAEYFINDYAFNNLFALKYLALSIIIAGGLGVVYEIMRNNIEVNLYFKNKTKEENEDVQKD